MASHTWYTAVLVVTSEVVGAEDREPLVDLQWRLVQATDPNEAYAKAMEIGREEETSYENEEGETVKWVFRGLHELIELDEAPSDGAELFSELSRGNPSDFVHDRERLRVFAVDEIKHLPAREVLDRYDRAAQQGDAADGPTGRCGSPFTLGVTNYRCPGGNVIWGWPLR